MTSDISAEKLANLIVPGRNVEFDGADDMKAAEIDDGALKRSHVPQ